MRESISSLPALFPGQSPTHGQDRLAWWDVFAPGGANERQFSFEEAQASSSNTLPNSRPIWAISPVVAFDRGLDRR